MLLKTRIIISCCFISLLSFFEEDCYASRPGSKECVKVSSASFTVRGRVIDTYGEPLIGATIREKGGANGTVTDVEGNFFLFVPDSAVLQISFVGYESQEVSVKGRSMLEVCLKENILLLDHVIVTALGLEKKESSLAYAVQKVRGEELNRVKEVIRSNGTKTDHGFGRKGSRCTGQQELFRHGRIGESQYPWGAVGGR